MKKEHSDNRLSVTKGGVDLMINPSADWKEIDPLHTDMIMFRAVENGFSMVRVTIKVCGNFFNMGLHYLPLLDSVDYCVTELNHTMFLRHNWYRLANGYTENKPVIIAENPYGGFVPKFVEMLNSGKGYDLFRIFLMEAAMNGCNMAYPYGAWMGNKIKDGFYAPSHLGKEIQGFLAENDRLFGKASGANILVLYGFASYRLLERQLLVNERLLCEDENDLLSYRIDTGHESLWSPFEEFTGFLSENNINYDVKVLRDDDMYKDDFSEKTLQGYELLILPDCSYMTPEQAVILKAYARAGGRVLVTGRTAENLPGWLDDIKALKSVNCVPVQKSREKAIESFKNAFRPAYSDLWQIRTDSGKVHCQITKLEKSIAVHLINYTYCKTSDRILPADVTLDIRLGRTDYDVETYTTGGEGVRCEVIPGSKNVFRIKLSGLPPYACIELKQTSDYTDFIFSQPEVDLQQPGI